MAPIAQAWTWLVSLVRSSLSDIALAAIVLFAGLVAARVLSLLVEEGLRKVKFDQALRTGFGISIRASGIVGQLIMWGISIITVLEALRILGINAFVVAGLGVFVIVVIAFSIVLALRDLVPNLVAGTEMRRKGFFTEGDVVIIDGERARVLEAGLLETILEQGGSRIVIPNAMLLRREIVVEGASSPLARDRAQASEDAAESNVEESEKE